MEFHGWDSFFTAVVAVLQETSEESITLDQRTITYALARIDNCVNGLRRIFSRLQAQETGSRPILDLVSNVHLLLEFFTLLHAKWSQANDEMARHLPSAVPTGSTMTQCLVRVVRRGDDGRPRLYMDQRQIEYLRSLQFSWSEIASLLGLSRSTLYRRRRDWGMQLGRGYVHCSDEDLEKLVSDLKSQMPDVGEIMLQGALVARGIRVSRRRLRVVIHKVDPINTALRWSTFVVQRPYSVPGANSLWHLGMHCCLMVTHMMCINIIFCCRWKS